MAVRRDRPRVALILLLTGLVLLAVAVLAVATAGTSNIGPPRSFVIFGAFVAAVVLLVGAGVARWRSG